MWIWEMKRVMSLLGVLCLCVCVFKTYGSFGLKVIPGQPILINYFFQQGKVHCKEKWLNLKLCNCGCKPGRFHKVCGIFSDGLLLHLLNT